MDGGQLGRHQLDLGDGLAQDADTSDGLQEKYDTSKWICVNV